ncbi:O-antigen ligase family protein [Candidatus Omnitrophota bacterium]
MTWPLVYIVLFLLPFFSTETSKPASAFLYGALSILFLYLYFSTPAKKRLKDLFLLVPLLAFLVIVIITAFASIYPPAALAKAAYFPLYALFFVAIAGFDSAEKKKIALTLAASSFLIALIAISQRLFYFTDMISYISANKPLFTKTEFFYIMDIARRARSVGVFHTPNLLASYLIMVNMAVLGLIFAAKKRIEIILLLGLLIVNLTALWLTRSFAGFAAFAFGIFVFTVLMLIKGKGSFKRAKFLLIALIACICILFTALFISRFFYADDAHKLSIALEGRLAFWKASLFAIADKPFAFAGLGNFEFIYRAYAPPISAETTMAHNLLLQLWIETGAYGLLAFAFFASMLILRTLKNILNSQTPPMLLAIRIGILSGVIAFLIHNMACFSFFVPETAVVWWVMCGLLICTNREAK